MSTSRYKKSNAWQTKATMVMRHFINHVIIRQPFSMYTNIVFITAANSGIGLEAIKALVNSTPAYHIFIGSHTICSGNFVVDKLRHLLVPSTSTVEAIQINVADNESVKKAMEYVNAKFGWLDILINNAYDTNMTGAQVTASLFAPLLIRSPWARLVFLTSGNSSLDCDFQKSKRESGMVLNSNDMPNESMGHLSNKEALNKCMLVWYSNLKEDGVKTFAICPRPLATSRGVNFPGNLKKLSARDAALGGDLVRLVVEGEREADVGKVITQDGAQAW